MRLPDNETPGFQSVIDGLVLDIAPVAVVCFGHSFSVVNHKGCFQSTSSEHRHYDLLVVQPNSNHYKDHEIIDLIKRRFPDELSVNVLSHSERSVSTALAEQHPFFTKVFSEGQVLYIADNSHLEIDKIGATDAISGESKHWRECKRSFELSESFLELASYALGNNIHDVAVFLLHQAMEQMCIASIKAHLKYRPATHNIVRLIALVSCYIPQARDLFPCNTSDERELLDFLKRAYSDVRYKACYRVPSHIAFSLLERVNDFKNLIEYKYGHEFGEAEEGQINPSSENE
jgi:HEPN domain-containing protein